MLVYQQGIREDAHRTVMKARVSVCKPKEQGDWMYEF